MKVLTLLFSLLPVNLFAQIPQNNRDEIAAPYQVIISEIMADPSPRISLPVFEYIELFNRGTTLVHLANWHLVLGTHSIVLPAEALEPGKYIIVCESTAKQEFDLFGKTLPISNMPAILNTGQTITLRSQQGEVIHTVTYSEKWYNDKKKSEGGWSIEIIDPDNPCGRAENWSASENPNGGTPGTVNSIYFRNPDELPPKVLRATVPNDTTVRLLFSESMDSASISSRWLYSANHDLLHPDFVDPDEPDYTSVLLSYPAAFSKNLIYSMAVLQTLSDCAGNQLLQNQAVNFGLADVPDTFDLSINEVLFDASSETTEFIELFNRSERIIDLASLSLQFRDLTTGEVAHSVSLHNNPYLLLPGHFVVIAKEAESLSQHCHPPDPSAILELPGLFMLPNQGGTIILKDSYNQTIDEFTYSEELHDPVLTFTCNISLERIDTEKPANDPENWHSASTSVCYSTPGVQNSQTALSGMATENITLSSESFSPDLDGLDDEVLIHMLLPEQGVIGNMEIYNVNGVKIKTLATNQLLGTDEFIIWDGTMDNQQVANLGIYIIYLEFIFPKGKVEKIKKVVTLTRRI
jgi:hypothetical protein